ncbi:MAG UNVERIFIED_CONTAM: hypothetical protein LVT10_19930 [Anaerolineae bacterium]
MTYLEPGYELAQQQDDAELTSALADSAAASVAGLVILPRCHARSHPCYRGGG